MKASNQLASKQNVSNEKVAVKAVKRTKVTKPVIQLIVGTAVLSAYLMMTLKHGEYMTTKAIAASFIIFVVLLVNTFNKSNKPEIN